MYIIQSTFIDQKVINAYHLIMLNINLHNIIEVMKKLQKYRLNKEGHELFSGNFIGKGDYV